MGCSRPKVYLKDFKKLALLFHVLQQLQFWYYVLKNHLSIFQGDLTTRVHMGSNNYHFKFKTLSYMYTVGSLHMHWNSLQAHGSNFSSIEICDRFLHQNTTIFPLQYLLLPTQPKTGKQDYMYTQSYTWNEYARVSNQVCVYRLAEPPPP